MVVLCGRKMDNTAFQDLFCVHVENSKLLPLYSVSKLAGEHASTRNSYDESQRDSLAHSLFFPTSGRTMPQKSSMEMEILFIFKRL